MKRIIIVISMALAFFITLQGITVSAQQTARVKNVNKHKGYVYIDQGRDDGFVMGATVCIESSSGKVIACGKVRRTSESHHAMIQVDREDAHHIVDGMKANLVVREKR